jgi:hypothetical protein
MATSDLLNELQKENFRADGDLERRLGDAILVQLEDQSGDISGMAVKWQVSVGALHTGMITDIHLSSQLPSL